MPSFLGCVLQTLRVEMSHNAPLSPTSNRKTCTTYLFPLQDGGWVCFQNGWSVFPCRTLEIPGASGSSAGTGTPCCSAHPVALPSPEGKGSSYHRKSWYPLERGEWKFIYCRDLLILANSHDGSSHVDKLQAGKKMLFCCCCCCCCCCCLSFFVFFLQGDEGGNWLVFSYRIIPDYGGE